MPAAGIRSRRAAAWREAPAAACSASPDAAKRGDGFIPVSEGTRGPADEPAPYREWSGRGRWVAPIGSEIEAQVERRWLPRLAHARHRLQRQPHQRRRRLRPAGRARQLAMERARILAVAEFDEQLRERQSGPGARRPASRCRTPCRRTGSAKRRGPPADAERDRAAPRRGRPPHGRGIARALFHTRRESRLGGASPAAKPGPAAPLPKRSVELGSITLTGGARLDHWRISDGHLFEKTIATGAILRDEHDASRDGWLPTARGGLSARLGRWLQPPLGSLSRLADADPQ